MAKYVFSTLITLVTLFHSYTIYSQNYAPYPQGNSGRKFMVSFNGSTPNYIDQFWYATDTVIAGQAYTTKLTIDGNEIFLREDVQAQQSLAYCAALQQELDITMPTNVQVGDTVDVTNIAYVFGVFPYYFHEGFTHELLGVVQNSSNYDIQFHVYSLELGNPDSPNFNCYALLYLRPGMGVGYHSDMASYTSQMVCLVHEGVELTNGMPNCFASIQDEIEQEIVLFPTLVDDVFQVKLLNDEQVYLQVFDATGKCIKGLNYKSLDYLACSDLNAGLYFVQFAQNHRIYRLKMMKL